MPLCIEADERGEEERDGFADNGNVEALGNEGQPVIRLRQGQSRIKISVGTSRLDNKVRYAR